MRNPPWEAKSKSLTAEAGKSARRIHKARQTLARERHRLAELTRPGHPSYVIAEEWEWAHELYKARLGKLLGLDGVNGCGLSFRQRDRTDLGEPCITTYVTRKLKRPTLARRSWRPAPSHVRSREHGRLDVDVVELGRVKRHTAIGSSLGRLHPSPNRGTIGGFALDAQTGERMALTAMHVTGLREFDAAGQPPFPISSPSHLDDPAGSVLGFLRAGSMRGIDAAKIALGPNQRPSLEIPGIGRVRGWRPTVFPGDQNAPVRLVGAVSGLQHGTIASPVTAIPDADLDVAILANIETRAGDSGCALVDPENLILGFLVGEGGSRLNNLRVFTPVSLVLARLDCELLKSTN